MDAVVVGGGLAGLAAAAYLARAGRSVAVVEKSSAVGGRARTQEQDGFHFNQGPHALYRGGAGIGVLRELGVEPRGGRPSGGFALRQGRLHTLPVGLGSLLATGLVSLPAKLEVARVLARLPQLDPGPLDAVSVADWLATATPRDDVRQVLAALLRVATYADAPERQSAGAALAQLQRAHRFGVLYLDGGWQTLVDGLRQAAVAAGARVLVQSQARALEWRGNGVTGVRLASGKTLPAGIVVLAVDPAAALELAGRPASLSDAVERRLPAFAACLDVALSRSPQPRRRFALGVDRPLYLSVHSAVARLAPDGGAVVHVARYLGPSPPVDAAAVERELEGLLDLAQPGWRGLLVRRRFAPSFPVSHDVSAAAAGGLAGRAAAVVADRPGVFLAGDWVGSEGLLADAALASARAAAQAATARDARRASAA
jgi:phytoene dehydrogenase-like protein